MFENSKKMNIEQMYKEKIFNVSYIHREKKMIKMSSVSIRFSFQMSETRIKPLDAIGSRRIVVFSHPSHTYTRIYNTCIIFLKCRVRSKYNI